MIKKLLMAAAIIISSSFAQADDPNCNGAFANPVTDYCWSCIFPLTLGGKGIFVNGQEDFQAPTSDTGFCMCDDPPRMGMKRGFWEPTRLVDVVRSPYCFVSLGGVSIDFGIDAPRHTQTHGKEAQSSNAFYHVHWYTNPLMFWLEVLMDETCLERGVFDLAYVTEIDPLWADSSLTFILNPDVAIFGNPIGQAACTADCVAATAGFPINQLHWCNGCQGSVFPLNGWVSSKTGGVMASSLLLARMTNKLHREMLMWSSSGDDGLCGMYPEPVMTKTNYKYQMTYPIPQTTKIAGKCCQPLGRSTIVWGAGKEFPVKGEDFAYQVFRKRDCCAGNLQNLLIP